MLAILFKATLISSEILYKTVHCYVHKYVVVQEHEYCKHELISHIDTNSNLLIQLVHKNSITYYNGISQ